MTARRIYRGSVKDIFQETTPTSRRFGRGYMEFRPSGDFSVFDYGTMPWGIEGKGDHLYKTSIRFFESLDEAGIQTHFDGDRGDRKIGIKLARMPDYAQIRRGMKRVIRIPIECIYTHVLTPVASLHGRLRRGEVDPESVGLGRAPERGETLILPEMRTTFSTKIEATDTYKDLSELARMSGLNSNDPRRIRQQTLRVAEALKRYATKQGLILADGKVEFLLGPDRELVVGDTGLSYDENRWLVEIGDGTYVDLSKQLPRNIYNIIAHEWKLSLKEAQIEHPNHPKKWPKPPDIDRHLRNLCMDACDVMSDALVDGDNWSDLLNVGERVFATLEDLKKQYGRDETGAIWTP